MENRSQERRQHTRFNDDNIQAIHDLLESDCCITPTEIAPEDVQWMTSVLLITTNGTGEDVTSSSCMAA